MAKIAGRKNAVPPPLKLALAPGATAAIISDIRGSHENLKLLLQNPKVSGADKIVFCGEYAGQGGDSAAVLELVRGLCASGRAAAIKVPGDRLIEWYARSGSRALILGELAAGENNIFADWARALGFAEVSDDNFDDVRAAILASRGAELAFVRAMPVSAELPGLWINAVPPRGGRQLLTGKPVWMESDSHNRGPVVIDGGRLIMTDGSSGADDGGQLNALLVSFDGEPRFDFAFASAGKTAAVLESYEPRRDNGFFKVTAGEELGVISRGEEFSLCIRRDGGQGYVKNEHIVTADGISRVRRTSLSSQLSVAAGETVEVLDEEPAYLAFVRKQNGDMGWIKKTAIRAQAKQSANLRDYM